MFHVKSTPIPVALQFEGHRIVHWYRNIFSHVPSTKEREIAAMLKAIHAGEDIVAARQKAVGLRLTTAAELVAAAVEETLAYYAFPEEHWRQFRPSNSSRRNAGNAGKGGSVVDETSVFSSSGLPF